MRIKVNSGGVYDEHTEDDSLVWVLAKVDPANPDVVEIDAEPADEPYVDLDVLEEARVQIERDRENRATAAASKAEYNEDIVYGVEMAVNVILRGSWTEAGVVAWWERPRTQLGGKTPRKVVASDPDAVVKLAIAGLSQGA